MADRTEQRLRDALTACADQVTEESLSLPPDLPRPKRRRWPALAAAAAVFVLVAGLAAVTFNDDRDYQPVAPPPAPSEPAPTTTSTSPACPPGERCVIQTADTLSQKLELVATNALASDQRYSDWVLRVAGGDVLARGGDVDGGDTGEAPGLRGRIQPYVLEDSLRCWAVDPVFAVCLLDTYGIGDTNHFLGMSRDKSGWSFDGRYPMSLWRMSVDLGELGLGEREPGKAGPGFYVIAVEHDPNLVDQPNWWARAWLWNGEELGCTKPVRSKEQLPNWHDVAPARASLDPTNCPGG